MIQCFLQYSLYIKLSKHAQAYKGKQHSQVHSPSLSLRLSLLTSYVMLLILWDTLCSMPGWYFRDPAPAWPPTRYWISWGRPLVDLLPLEAACVKFSESLVYRGHLTWIWESLRAHTEQLSPALTWPAGTIMQSCNISISVNIYWQPTLEQMLWDESSGNKQWPPSKASLLEIKLPCTQVKQWRVSLA